MKKQDKLMLQLKVIQEDVIMTLDIIIVILCFGFNFNITGYIFLFIAIIQFIYLAYHNIKYRNKEINYVTK